MSQKPSTVALRASLFYAIIAGLWILFSDQLVEKLVRDREWMTRLEIFKGWFFVAFTGILFFLVLRRLLASEQEKQAELKVAEARMKLQKDALEMIATGKPLPATLEMMLRSIETLMPETTASILLLDADGVHLRHGAAPSLPAEYIRAIDGAAIGPKAGSCGTAAFRGSPVFVSNIADDPLWSDYKQLALPHGLRACWSTPIFDEQKKVLGTFAIYHRQPGLPATNDIRIIELVTATAATAILKARTEESLRESEERFRTLVEQASDAIFTHDMDGRLVDVNERACAILGYSREELLRLTVAQFPPEEVRAICQNLRPGEFKIVPGQHRRKDGTTFPVEASLSLHQVRGQKLTAALVRDVTERKEYEAKLAQSFSLLRTTLEASTSGILAVDDHGKISAYNQRFLQLWNIPAELATAAPDDVVLEFARPQLADPEAFLRRVRELYAQPEAESFDTLQLKNGRVLERSSRPQRLGEKIVGRVWSFWDVTEQRRAEQQLAVSEASYRNFFNTISDAIFVLDETGKFLAVNDGAVAMYGLAKEEMIGQTPELLSAPGRNDSAATAALIQRALAGEPQQFEWWGRRKNGAVFPKEVHLEKGSYFGRPVLFASGRDISKRRQAEADLRYERQLLRTLIDLAPDLIFVKDTESRYLIVNTALAACYGQTPAQMLGRADADFLPAKMAAHFRASELRVMAANTCFAFEDTIVFPDGKSRTLVTNMVAFHNGLGKVCGLVGIGRDVTGERTIEKSMRLQSVALEAAANAILITDHNGSIEWVNPAFTRCTGYTLAECLGKNPRALLRSGKHDRAFYQHLWDTILAGQIWHGEMTNRRKDGSLFHEEMTITPLLDRENRTTHFIAIRQDITERKAMEQSLLKTQAMYSSLVEQMPVCVFRKNVAGCYEFANWHYCELKGLQREDIIGHTPQAVANLMFNKPTIAGRKNPDERQFAIEGEGHHEAIMRDGKTIEVDREFSTPDGQLRFFHVVKSPVYDNHHRLIGSQGVMFDITDKQRMEKERQNLETQLRQSQKMEAIGQLSGGIAHDFNNILTVIQGNAALLLDFDQNPAEIRECATQISDAAERAAGLTRQLLLFSRKQQMLPVPLNLNETVTQMTRMLQRILGEDIALRSEYAPALPRIHADAGMIEQIILNLAVNARDAMPDGGKLTIRTWVENFRPEDRPENAPAEPHVGLSMTDTGTGIAPEILPRIFDPFFTTKEVGKGTGLGLATVYGIVQQHHGQIRVQSELNGGSTFTIYFPAWSESESMPAEPVARNPAARGSETILVVEDESPLRALVSDLLRRHGYSVLLAGSGPAALALWAAHREQIQLVFTDIIMPEGVNGLELGRQLQANKPALKIIYTSGYTGDTPQSIALVEGTNFIRKPFRPEILLNLIRKILDESPSKR